MRKAASLEPMGPEQDQRISDVIVRERSRLRRFIRRRVPNASDAEDIMQDVFYELVEANRLLMPIATDVDRVLGLLRRGEVAAAVDAYGGDLLPGTESPALVEMGEYVAVAVREALIADPQPDAVLHYAELAPYDTAVLEACLARLALDGRLGHPSIPLLKARLAVADA